MRGSRRLPMSLRWVSSTPSLNFMPNMRTGFCHVFLNIIVCDHLIGNLRLMRVWRINLHTSYSD